MNVTPQRQMPIGHVTTNTGDPLILNLSQLHTNNGLIIVSRGVSTQSPNQHLAQGQQLGHNHTINQSHQEQLSHHHPVALQLSQGMQLAESFNSW